MSTADNWDLTIPEDPAELVAELRRHGAVPGKRITLHVHPEPELAPGPDADKPEREPLSFIGSFDGPPDLSTNTEKYLKGFGE